MNTVFTSADILLPENEQARTWAVIACDQFSSQPEYWKKVEELVKDKPSTLSLILPEALLGTEKGQEHEKQISTSMEALLDQRILKEFPHSYIYVERTLQDGRLRRGLVGAIDLEDYDYHVGSHSVIRATEATILDRIPPRMAIRKKASLELPHILLLADDDRDQLFSKLQSNTDKLEPLYDFDLMLDGGHLKGWLVDQDHAPLFESSFEGYLKEACNRYDGMGLVVGDGNHSLATAKAIWEEVRLSLSDEEKENHPARYALVELESIHEPSLDFEPIHRLLTHVNSDHLKTSIKIAFSAKEGQKGQSITLVDQNGCEDVVLAIDENALALSWLQPFLDSYLEMFGGSMDFIHGDDSLKELAAKENTLGILLPPISKKGLFEGVVEHGSLPRKTFSMGNAQDKRYYMEARKIR